MKLARLNHILIPPTREGRDRLRRSWLGQLLRPLGWLYNALSREGRVLIVLILFVGTAGVEVRTTQTYMLWSGLFSLWLVALLLRSAFRLRDVKLRVATAARVSVGEPLTLTIELTNRSRRDYHNVRTSHPFLPWDGAWLEQPSPVALLEAGKSVRQRASARFVSRGEHHLDVFSAGIIVPFGLSIGPRISSDGARFLVVPRIAPVERIELPRGQRHQPGGVAQASSCGEAMELAGVRPYRRGDAVRDLHPKTWARTGIPHVREYQQEYFTRIGVVIDNDAEQNSERSFEAALSLAAGVVAHLSRGDALIVVLVVGQRIHSFTIGRSLGFLPQALDLLACAKRSEAVDFAKLGALLDPVLARLSALIVITESEQLSRSLLVDHVERRGVVCRVLRLVDDRTLAWTRGNAPLSLRAASPRERVVTVGSIEDERPLSL